MKPLPSLRISPAPLNRAALVSFNDIAKFFGITPAKLRAEFRCSLVPLPSVLLKPKEAKGPVSKAVSGYSLIMARAKTGEISMLDLAMDELSKTRGIQAMRATEKYADDAAALDAFERMMETITTTYMVSSLEILLFLNAKNACLSPCIPTKKEMAKVPKVFQPYYTYLVLDAYRERSSYASLEDAIEHLNEHQSMKHLVRGRCMDTRHGLFWRPAKTAAMAEVVS